MDDSYLERTYVTTLDVAKINTYYDNISWEKLLNTTISEDQKHRLNPQKNYYDGARWNSLYDSMKKGFYENKFPEVIKVKDEYYTFNGNHRIRVWKELNNKEIKVMINPFYENDMHIFYEKKNYYEEIYHGNINKR